MIFNKKASKMSAKSFILFEYGYRCFTGDSLCLSWLVNEANICNRQIVILVC